MRSTGRRHLTRNRLLIAIFVMVGVAAAAWFGGRYPLARWAVRRALDSAGLSPASFNVESVGLGTLRMTNLSVGSAAWLTAADVRVTFTLGDLLAARVGTLRLEGVQWTIRVQDGAVDWGYQPRTRAAPPSPELPMSHVEIVASSIHVVAGDDAHDVQLAARMAPGALGAIAGQVDLMTLNRTATIDFRASSDQQGLLVGMEGHAENDVSGQIAPSVSASPRATWQASARRNRLGGAMQIELDLTLEAIVERVGDMELALSRARVTGRLDLGDHGIISGTSRIKAQEMQVGGLMIRTLDLNATKAEGSAVDLEIEATGDGWGLPAASGRARWDSTTRGSDESPSTTTLTATLRTEEPVSIQLESAGITGMVESIAAEGLWISDKSGVGGLRGRVVLDGGSLRAGDMALSDAHAELEMRDPETVAVSLLAATIGDGSRVSADPFTWNPRVPRVEARLAFSNLSLEHWLPIISGERATGEGRVSGNADVSLNWTGGSVRLEQVKGSLGADPAHGFIQVRDAESLGDLLEKQDPRFANDDVMRPVRDKIVAALQDFAFNTLTIDLSRRGDRTAALTYLSGFGRHGEDPQGLNLTLDLQVQDSFVDLARRMAAKSRIREAAGNALAEFFEETPAAQEKR